MDREPRILVVGASCAGLSAAEALRARGYSSVTVIEARERPGGQSYSSTTQRPDGGSARYEGGTVWAIPSPLVDHLARRHGVVRDVVGLPPIRYLELDAGGRIESPWRYLLRQRSTGALARAMTRLLVVLRRLEAPSRGGLAGLVAARPELLDDAPTWFRAAGLEALFDGVFPIVGNTLTGGYVDGVPALYYVRTLMLLLRFPLARLLALDLPHYRGGNDVVWRRVAAAHDVRYGEPVRAVRRGDEIEVVTPRGRHLGDALIWAAPIDRFAATAELDDDEVGLFDGVRTFSRAVFTCEVRGLPPGLQTQLHGLAANNPGHLPYSMYEVEAGAGIYNFYSFLRYPGDPRQATIDDARRGVVDLVTRLGGEVVGERGVQVWERFFPHLDRERLASGALQRIEALQGRRGIYFAGELLAHITVPLNAEYAAGLVARHFPRRTRVSLREQVIDAVPALRRRRVG